METKQSELYSEDEDIDSWYKYPEYRMWINKLYLADRLGYQCGPSGIPVPEEKQYVVRPIMNLAGMSVGARVVTLSPDDRPGQNVPAGYFWQEYFEGIHLSVDYVRQKQTHGNPFKILNVYEGDKDKDTLYKFIKWTKRYYQSIPLPTFINNLNVDKLNVEMIMMEDGSKKIIEIHLRNGFDHMMKYNEMIPVFKGEPTRKDGFIFIKSPADGHGELLYPRIGYLVK